MSIITCKKGLAAVLVVAITAYIVQKMTDYNNIVHVPQEFYDVIIVGAGTAGTVLARRISDHSDIHVLLIEAGDTETWLSGVPLISPMLQTTSANWDYKTVPQRHAMWGMINKQSSWPRGRVLGGSSSINYFIHNWGIPEDFSRWPEGWNYSNIIKYFMKSEDYVPKNSKRTAHRGRRGMLKVTEFDVKESIVAQAFLKGAKNLGLKILDLNSGERVGAMASQNTIFNGRRWSNFRGYLDSLGKRNNLDILTGSLVTKVHFKGNVAIGVQLMTLHNSKQYNVLARKEVILCAGAIESPHILLLSGIGPAEQLKKYQIPVVVDLPDVGQQLEDHLNIPLYFHLDQPLSVTEAKAKSGAEILRYLVSGKGYLSQSGVEAVARANLPKNNSSLPDLYFILFNVGSITWDVFGRISNYEKDVFVHTFPDMYNQSKEGFVILASCLHPYSKGQLTLKSDNPSEPPNIDPQYLSEEHDLKCAVEAMKMAFKLVNIRSFRKLGLRLHVPTFPHCSQYETRIDNDDFLACWLQTISITGNHPLGTSRIGAVLDSNLRVRGVQRLRVVDSSSIPGQLSGPPNAVITMLAERASDLILESLTSYGLS